MNKNYKDNLIRKNFKKKELKILIYKYSLLNIKNLKYKKYYFYNFIKKYHLNWSSSRIVNRCILSGRVRWSYKRFRLSRMMFKNLCDYGKIHGVRRATW